MVNVQIQRNRKLNPISFSVPDSFCWFRYELYKLSSFLKVLISTLYVRQGFVGDL